MKPAVLEITQRIRERSAPLRRAYLERLERMARRPRANDRLGCANVAHAYAALPANDKLRVVAERGPNLAIVTSYNDMLSAHQPYETWPALIRDEARRLGATAQVAGGVPAMCDGVTQGQPGMELSLFSRDTIAMGTAVALSHDVFDGALLLGVCDKIVPGLLIGALNFGHLACVFVPAGPMSSGLPNEAKAKVREQFAAGKALMGAGEGMSKGGGAKGWPSRSSAGTATWSAKSLRSDSVLPSAGVSGRTRKSSVVPAATRAETRRASADVPTSSRRRL